VSIRAEELQAAYAGGAGAWAAGPAAMYRRMAEPLVTTCPIPVAGASVLDFGAGTGATTAALAAAGAGVVGLDLTLDMLRADRAQRPPAVNADATRMPFRASAFDAAVGAFVLSHIPTPVDALAEAARVVRGDGAVMTVGFDGRWEFPAKETIERVMETFGARRPQWYDRFKRDVEPLTSLPDRLAAVATSAGLTEVQVREHTLDTGVRDTDGIVAWRLGMPIYAPFMAGLDDARRKQVLDALRAAVGPHPEPLVPQLLVLSARVPSPSR
jgi:ubiquinone/menaquinone biosynthesis C-methylase UbiE